MSAVEFHSGIADPLDFACRLLRKAFRKGARVLVTVEPGALAALDERLWTFEAQEFVPHLRWAPARAAAAARTPIWLVAGALPPLDPPALPPVLVNLGAPVVDEPQRFERIIEIVADDEAPRRAGRERWRRYEALGLPITHHRSAAGA